MQIQDTIAALATAPGAGAIAVIRVSGAEALAIVSDLFKAKSGKKLIDQDSHTLHLGNIVDGSRIIDEALVSIFKGKRSYTGEPTVEISCHGSSYIQQEILQLLFRNGCRAAKAARAVQDLRLQVGQVFGSHSCRQVSGMLTLSSRSSR